MTSKRKAEANRRNARRSTGPKTPEGKRRSAQNARTHNLTGHQLVLTLEEQPQFDALFQTYLDEIHPQSQIERDLVKDIAAARWRISRVWRMETAHLDLQVDLDIPGVKDRFVTIDDDARLALAFQNLADNSNTLELTHRYEARLYRQYHRSLDKLLALRRPTPPPTPDSALTPSPQKGKNEPTGLETPGPPVPSSTPEPAPEPTPPPASLSRPAGLLCLLFAFVLFCACSLALAAPLNLTHATPHHVDKRTPRLAAVPAHGQEPDVPRRDLLRNTAAALLAQPAARKLVEEARQKKLLLQTGYVWRCHEGINAALKAAREGWLGEVYMVRGTMNSDRGPGERAIEARYKGGGLFELSGHVIDRVVELLGRPGKIKSWLRHDTSFPDDLADNNLAVFEYDRALAVIAQSARMAGSTAHRSLEIIGTDGTVMVWPESEPPKMRVYLRKAQGPYAAGWQDLNLPPQPRFVGDFEELARAIRTGQPLKLSYDHELLLQETLLRASGEMT